MADIHYNLLQQLLLWKGYTLIDPVEVPIAIIRNTGSQASAVGLFGNPYCKVWNIRNLLIINLDI